MKKYLLLAIVSSSLLADDHLFFSPDAIATHLEQYNEEEKQDVEKDLVVVRSVCFSGKKAESEHPVYVATAGAPGARKSTILERAMKACPPMADAVYIDPDQRALKFMVHTYYAQNLSAFAVSAYSDYAMATKAGYQKWRGASNYIALTLLEEAFAEGRDIVHGTTCTGAHVPYFLEKVKEAGYEVVLLLCSCEDSLREQAIRYRNEEQKFYQSSPEDALSKGKLFPERMWAYFTYADVLYLYWSDTLFEKERLAAVLRNGQLDVRDSDALDLFVDKFSGDRIALESEGVLIPSWNEVLESYQSRFR
jgi:predicted ABC-type ATPase